MPHVTDIAELDNHMRTYSVMHGKFLCVRDLKNFHSLGKNLSSAGAGNHLGHK